VPWITGTDGTTSPAIIRCWVTTVPTATVVTTTSNIVWVDCGWYTGTASATTVPQSYWLPGTGAMAAMRNYEQAERQVERQAAAVRGHLPDVKERAINLLLEHLTPEQRETFRNNDWFVVDGGKSKTKYRIHSRGSLMANIDVIKDDKTLHRLCAHCDVHAIPLGDQLLAQKLMLEFDEDEFLRIANRH